MRRAFQVTSRCICTAPTRHLMVTMMADIQDNSMGNRRKGCAEDRERISKVILKVQGENETVAYPAGVPLTIDNMSMP